jgi:hypothetical protein
MVEEELTIQQEIGEILHLKPGDFFFSKRNSEPMDHHKAREEKCSF